MELLLKKDDFEMRIDPSATMISHFNKMIEQTRERIDVCKRRCDLLKKDYEAMSKKTIEKEVEEKENEKDGKNDKNDDSISGSYLKLLESDDDDEESDNIQIGSELNTQLDFDSATSTTTKVIVNLEDMENDELQTTQDDN